MKRLSLIVGMFALIFLSSCREIVNTVLDIFPPFEVPFSTQISAPFVGVSTTSYTKVPEIGMNINLDDQIKARNPKYSIRNVKSVKMSELTATYVSSSQGTKLDVIKNARIYVKSGNLPDKLIASVENNTNPNQIVFTTTNSEIVDYFQTNQNSLVIEVQGSKVAADQITMKLNAVFKVRAEL
ncbi:hypothetical protein [Kaistella daneshvariae]|jgi:hypothetical protein|nr:hypothetical protein [Kaistella daneshvariae]